MHTTYTWCAHLNTHVGYEECDEVWRDIVKHRILHLDFGDKVPYTSSKDKHMYTHTLYTCMLLYYMDECTKHALDGGAGAQLVA